MCSYLSKVVFNMTEGKINVDKRNVNFDYFIYLSHHFLFLFSWEN